MDWNLFWKGDLSFLVFFRGKHMWRAVIDRVFFPFYLEQRANRAENASNVSNVSIIDWEFGGIVRYMEVYG